MDGLPYDETKGRLDNIMCIVDSNTILLSWTENTIDDRYLAVKNCWDVLSKSINAHGKKYKIIKIPLPKNDIRNSDDIKMIDFNIYHNRILANQKLVTSYLNLYISNKVVIIPTFNDEESETKLLDILSKTNVFNNKQIVLFDARELILGKSGIHSLICHQPALISTT
ncbi:agmatine deiminase family protein [Spiroplasma endosymbiont of Melieria omissa]|uniref:agmatine deiminase family protein n=1 Tax=Spiroplasma endosymbiont of Melieria omissa TaxID=3139324 RepID=UPI003CCA9ADC